MKLLLVLGVLALLVVVSKLRADQPTDPYPKVTASESGSAFFKMVPAKWRNGIKERQPFGLAYRLDEDGQSIELWRTTGWYDFEVYLSNDGDHLVRIGPWARDKKDHSDLAVAFYHRGNLLKQYAVRDLIKDPSTLEESVSHYRWTADVQTLPNGITAQFGDESVFHLVMIDKTVYDFDFKTGAITNTEVDHGAKSPDETFQAWDTDQRERAARLYRNSDFQKAFEPRFNIEEMRTGAFAFPFRGEGWSASLIPKKKLPQRAKAKAYLAISGDKLVVPLTAAEVETRLATCLSHPFIVRCFSEKGAQDVVMSISNDRLYADKERLLSGLKLVFSKDFTDQDLSHWVQIEMAFSQTQIDVFVNAETGQLIHESLDVFPRTFVLDTSGILK